MTHKTNDPISYEEEDRANRQMAFLEQLKKQDDARKETEAKVVFWATFAVNMGVLAGVLCMELTRHTANYGSTIIIACLAALCIVVAYFRYRSIISTYSPKE